MRNKNESDTNELSALNESQIIICSHLTEQFNRGLTHKRTKDSFIQITCGLPHVLLYQITT